MIETAQKIRVILRAFMLDRMPDAKARVISMSGIFRGRFMTSAHSSIVV